MPHVYPVQDRPESVSYLNELEPEDFEALLEASLENLRRRAIRPYRLSDEVPVYVLDGDFFAPAKLLDTGMLRGLAEALQTELLMVAAPTCEVAFVAPLSDDMGFVGAFFALVQSTFEEAKSGALSPLVFAAAPGQGVQGVMRIQESEVEPEAPVAKPQVEEASGQEAPEEEATAPRKPWWKRLFGL